MQSSETESDLIRLAKSDYIMLHLPISASVHVVYVLGYPSYTTSAPTFHLTSHLQSANLICAPGPYVSQQYRCFYWPSAAVEHKLWGARIYRSAGSAPYSPRRCGLLSGHGSCFWGDRGREASGIRFVSTEDGMEMLRV